MYAYLYVYMYVYAFLVIGKREMGVRGDKTAGKIWIRLVRVDYNTYTGCFFTLGLPLKVPSTKKLI